MSAEVTVHPRRPPREDRPAAVERPPIASEALFGPAREVLIRHGETIYRLRITSKDKLILTK